MCDEIKQSDDLSCCGLKAFERNHYFYGKLLTVRDFETEQAYFINKHRLVNRLVHGSGVVCGLKVESKAGTVITVRQGVALDCCGREVVVPQDTDVDISREEAFSGPGNNSVYVSLRYKACGKVKVPVVSDVSACEETCCFSRVMEGYEIEISRDAPDGCGADAPSLCPEWDSYLKGGAGEAFVDEWKDCPAVRDEGVLLAVITKNAAGFTISNKARRLVFNNQVLYKLINCVNSKVETKPDLPRIDKISWRHGDIHKDDSVEKRLEEIKKDGLTISFSKEVDSGGIDYNILKMSLVSYGKFDKEDIFVPGQTVDLPVRFISRRAKEITISPFLKAREGKDGYFEKALHNMVIAAGERIGKLGLDAKLDNVFVKLHIQLKGDFVKDKEKGILSLDGNHLGIPTGDGVEGGLFESWFEFAFDWSLIEKIKGFVPPKFIAVEGVSEKVNSPAEKVKAILEALAENNLLIKNKKGEYKRAVEAPQ